MLQGTRMLLQGIRMLQGTTMLQGTRMLLDLLSETAFCGKGAKVGPRIVMTDNSSAEHSAIQEAWSNSVLLLCNFHFVK